MTLPAPDPDPYPNQCPDLLPTSSGKPHLDALGNPYRCELGRDHGGPLHSGGGVRWPNRDYSPRPLRPRAAGEPVVLTLHAEPDILDGGWVAGCPELPGCFSQGKTSTAALAALCDAVAGALGLTAARTKIRSGGDHHERRD